MNYLTFTGLAKSKANYNRFRPDLVFLTEI